MSQSNTIDLRGYEQVASRAEAEEYAAMLGYSGYIYGIGGTVKDVDPELMPDINKDNPLLGITKVSELLSLLDKDSSYLIKVKLVRKGTLQIIENEMLNNSAKHPSDWGKLTERWNILRHLSEAIFRFIDFNLAVNHAKFTLVHLGDI